MKGCPHLYAPPASHSQGRGNKRRESGCARSWLLIAFWLWAQPPHPRYHQSRPSYSMCWTPVVGHHSHVGLGYIFVASSRQYKNVKPSFAIEAVKTAFHSSPHLSAFAFHWGAGAGTLVSQTRGLCWSSFAREEDATSLLRVLRGDDVQRPRPRPRRQQQGQGQGGAGDCGG